MTINDQYSYNPQPKRNALTDQAIKALKVILIEPACMLEPCSLNFCFLPLFSNFKGLPPSSRKFPEVTMLKWVIFDQKFESQTSKVKFDPLK